MMYNAFAQFLDNNSIVRPTSHLAGMVFEARWRPVQEEFLVYRKTYRDYKLEYDKVVKRFERYGSLPMEMELKEFPFNFENPQQAKLQLRAATQAMNVEKLNKLSAIWLEKLETEWLNFLKSNTNGHNMVVLKSDFEPTEENQKKFSSAVEQKKFAQISMFTIPQWVCCTVEELEAYASFFAPAMTKVEFI